MEDSSSGNEAIQSSLMSLVAYYDLAAATFEKNYWVSTSTKPFGDEHAEERRHLTNRIRNFGSGRTADVGAGTGHWLPHYVSNAYEVTIFEPSSEMAQLALKTVSSLSNVDAEKVSLVRGDHRSLNGLYDSILLSHVLGHYDITTQNIILRSVLSHLDSKGSLLVVDAVWNSEAALVHPSRTGLVGRLTKSGVHYVYKHYFLPLEIEELLTGLQTEVIEHYVGSHFWISELRHPLKNGYSN